MASFQEAVGSNGPVFVLGGGRETLTAARMEELLSQIPADLDPVGICLSNKSFTIEAAEVISKRLSTFKNIRVVDISDIIAGRMEEEALQVFALISNSLAGNTIIELNISDNALGSKGVHACKSLLVSKTLEKLYICNNGMAAETGDLIAELLLEGGCPPLRALHFYNNMSGNVGAAAVGRIVQQCPHLTDFRFSATRSNAVGCLEISKALQNVTGLTHLDLADNIFSGKAGALLANAIKNQRNLRNINLRDAGLGPDNSVAVVEAIIEAEARLTHFDFSGNEITADECNTLADYLKSDLAKDLLHLSLDENEIGTEGIVAIADALRSSKPNLETLSACNCEISAAGAIRLSQIVTRILPTFRVLKIDGNQICESAVEVMKGLFIQSGKVLEEMEDNDDEGDEDHEDELALWADATSIVASDGTADELAAELAKASIV